VASQVLYDVPHQHVTVDDDDDDKVLVAAAVWQHPLMKTELMPLVQSC